MSDKQIQENENPRSTTYQMDDHFIKMSKEVDLKNEAVELHRCQKIGFQNRYIHFPEFISYDPDSNQLTTRHISSTESLFNLMWNGTSFLSHCRNNTIDIPLLMDRIRELGLWLKAYHNSSHFPEYNVQAADNLIELYHNKIDAIKRHELLDNKFLNRVKDHFIPAIDDIKTDEYQKKSCNRFCQIHGDFLAYNMLVDSDWNIHILDFGDTRIGSSFEDICRFYELLQAMAQTNLWRKKIFNKALSVFINGYGLPRNINANPFFRSVRALNGIIHCIAEFKQLQTCTYSIVTTLELKQITLASLRWIAKEVNMPFFRIF